MLKYKPIKFKAFKIFFRNHDDLDLLMIADVKKGKDHDPQDDLAPPDDLAHADVRSDHDHVVLVEIDPDLADVDHDLQLQIPLRYLIYQLIWSRESLRKFLNDTVPLR